MTPQDEAALVAEQLVARLRSRLRVSDGIYMADVCRVDVEAAISFIEECLRQRPVVEAARACLHGEIEDGAANLDALFCAFDALDAAGAGGESIEAADATELIVAVVEEMKERTTVAVAAARADGYAAGKAESAPADEHKHVLSIGGPWCRICGDNLPPKRMQASDLNTEEGMRWALARDARMHATYEYGRRDGQRQGEQAGYIRGLKEAEARALRQSDGDHGTPEWEILMEIRALIEKAQR